MLARLEDLDDESFFTNENTTFVILLLCHSSKRHLFAGILVVFSPQRKSVARVRKNTSSGISKAEYLSLFSEAIKAGSKNKKTALSYFWENFGFYTSF